MKKVDLGLHMNISIYTVKCTQVLITFDLIHNLIFFILTLPKFIKQLDFL